MFRHPGPDISQTVADPGDSVLENAAFNNADAEQLSDLEFLRKFIWLVEEHCKFLRKQNSTVMQLGCTLYCT